MEASEAEYFQCNPNAAIAEIERLRAALRPFAEARGRYSNDESDDTPMVTACDLKVGHLTDARDCLKR